MRTPPGPGKKTSEISEAPRRGANPKQLAEAGVREEVEDEKGAAGPGKLEDGGEERDRGEDERQGEVRKTEEEILEHLERLERAWEARRFPERGGRRAFPGDFISHSIAPSTSSSDTLAKLVE